MHQEIVLGIDEAGRGPLAGPVVAAGVVLNPESPIAGLGDSKKLSEKKRDELYKQIENRALFVYKCAIDPPTIDRINILEATFMAMAQVISTAKQQIKPDLVLIDGNKTVPHQDDIKQVSIIKGDTSVECIMAASIIAKVYRDSLMRDLHQKYPDYSFDQHKGYGTKSHIEAILKFGPCPMHRYSFAPIKTMRHRCHER